MTDALVRKLTTSLQKGSLSDRVAQERDTKRRFLVLDCSGSMAEYCEPGRAKIDALREIVTALRAEDVPFRQIVFGGCGAQLMDTIPDPCGGTPMAEALALARQHQSERVVVISDGIPDDETETAKEAKQIRCPMDIFYVGPRPHPGEAFLRGLAKSSGGLYQETTLTRDGTKALAAQTKARLALPR